MPHFKSAFPSKFLSAAEIDIPYDAVIKAIVFENVGTDDKPEKKLVATFEEASHKPIVLNQTRCEAIAEIAQTPDYTLWPGTKVNVSRGSTRYAGQKVSCIAIGPPTVATMPRKSKPQRSIKIALGESDPGF